MTAKSLPWALLAIVLSVVFLPLTLFPVLFDELSRRTEPLYRIGAAPKDWAWGQYEKSRCTE